ncbi:DDB1- and CUL4-associated factor 13 [Nowakowskiella sp. JEL0078]|nr:DDB1- and CUL4-associated factor 13 [Nowakowskiella sp. JEL0078]
MKVKALSRVDSTYERERTGDIHKLQRNLSTAEHPFQRAREYTRARNATKLERHFAKPFVAALSGHIDGVYCLAKHPTVLNTIVSGSADGEMRLWDLAAQETLWSTTAHKGFVRGIAFVPFRDSFFSVGEDKVVKLWDRKQKEPLNSYLYPNAFT